MIDMDKTIKTGYALFVPAYIMCMLDALLISLSTFGDLPYASYVSIALRVGSALLVISKLILEQRYSLSLLLYMILTGLLLTVVFFRSTYNHIFYLLLFMLGTRCVDTESIVRLDFYLRIGLMLLIIFCSLTGIVENYITYRTGTQDYRYSLGFAHPNTFASLIMLLMLEDAWLHKRRFNVLYMLAMLVTAVLVFVITLNRTAVMIIMLFPFMLLLTRNRKNKSRISGKATVMGQLAFPLAVIISVLAMNLCTENPIFGLLDKLMSNRFTNCAVLYERYGIPLFGQRVELVSMKIARREQINIALLDVAYLRTLLQAGPLVLLLMGWLHFNAVRYAVSQNDRVKLLVICIFAAYGISESLYNNVFMNFSLVVGACGVFDVFEGSRREAFPEL